MELPKVLTEISGAYQQILGSNLCGIYVHGSLAFGCFHPGTSDIDFLVVVHEDVPQRQKESLIQTLCALRKDAPPKGLEMSVVLLKDCRDFSYPTPFLLHFSNAHTGKMESDLPEYCRTMQGVDADLAAHFTVVKHVGITLYGKPIEEVFGEVPKASYLDSIKADVENAQADIAGNPVYIILNLCRVLAYKKDGLVLSKAGGGKWAAAHLPPEYKGLVGQALDAYASGREMAYNPLTAQPFAKHMISLIFGAQAGPGI